MNKILCNKCMQEMVTVDYPCGKYVEPCECTKEELAEELYNEAKTEGYELGYDDARQLKPMRM